MKISYLFDELDKILAIIGIIFSSTLTIWISIVIVHPIYVMVCILCLMVCIEYLIIRRFIYPSSIPSLEELRCSTPLYITLNILFFLLLSYSIISIYLRTDPYIRPLGYFISTALMAVIVANEILFLSLQKSKICFTLCKIIIIGMSLVFSQILIFPSVVGIDPGWHMWFTLKILDKGHIPEGLSYSKLPIMNLIIGMTSLVTGLGYKMATMFSISFLQVVCDALFVFLLGKFLISTKVGLFASLFLQIANIHIWFGYWAIPTTAAATLVLPIIFILFKIRRDKPFIGTSVVMFLMGTLILTHTVTAMFLAIFLFVSWAAFETYIRLFQEEKTHKSITLTISILFSIGMLAYWTYISGHIMRLSNIIKMGFSIRLLYDSSYKHLSIIYFWETLFNYLGFLLFFAFSFFGFFYIMSKQFRNSQRFTISIGSIVILSIAFFQLLAGKDLIANRWNYFSQIMCAIPLALSVAMFNSIFEHRLIKVSLMSVLVFVLSFLLIISPEANIDNHFFSPNVGVRFAFTESEMIGASFFAQNSIGNISSDSDYSTGRGSSIFGNYYNVSYDRILSLDDSLCSGNFTRDGTIIIIRREIVDRPFRLSSGIYRVDYDPNKVLSNSGFNRIYDSFSITAYL